MDYNTQDSSTVMSLEKLIEAEIKDIEQYFQTMFNFIDTQPQISTYVVPSMTIEVYSFLEFWLKEICLKHSRERGLKDVNINEIKQDIFKALHKFLKSDAQVDMSSVNNSYDSLHDLSKIRNAFIHYGSHISNDHKNISRLKQIKDVSLSQSPGSYFLEIIEPRNFIFDKLDDVRKYLLAACRKD